MKILKRFLILLLVLLFPFFAHAENCLVASGSVTQANMRISAVNGTAFIDFSAADVLTSKLGNLLVAKDSSGRSIQGWIKVGGSAETKAAAKDVDGITKANPGVLTLAAGHGYANLNLVYFSGLTEMTDLNTKYRVLTGNSGDTFQVGDTSAYAAAETTGGNCIQLITTPSATGVTIVSTKGGSTYNFSAKDSAFNYNDSSGYTYLIYKTPNVLIASGTFTAANARNSFDATTAFCEASGLDLSPYAGTDAGSTPYLIELEDASGDVAWGFGGAVGGGETLGSEYLDNNSFTGTWSSNIPQNWNLNGTQNETNFLQADDAGDRVRIVSGDGSLMGINKNGMVASKGIPTGALLKGSIVVDSITGTLRFSGGTGWDAFPVAQITTAGTKTGYGALPVGVQDMFYIIRSFSNNVDAWVSNSSLKQVTDCAVTGLHIFTARNGTTRGWKVIGATFGMNDNMKYRVYYLGN